MQHAICEGDLCSNMTCVLPGVCSALFRLAPEPRGDLERRSLVLICNEGAHCPGSAGLLRARDLPGKYSKDPFQPKRLQFTLQSRSR